jgi:predicted transcriptional regulator
MKKHTPRTTSVAINPSKLRSIKEFKTGVDRLSEHAEVVHELNDSLNEAMDELKAELVRQGRLAAVIEDRMDAIRQRICAISANMRLEEIAFELEFSGEHVMAEEIHRRTQKVFDKVLPEWNLDDALERREKAEFDYMVSRTRLNLDCPWSVIDA